MRAAALIAATSFALLLAPSFVAGQDGLRSASLPERPIASPPPGPSDLFRATPQTYGPNPHPGRPPFVFPGGVVYGGWPWPYESPYDRDRGNASNDASRRRERDATPYGYLQLQSRPDEAMVFVDGFYIGTVADVRRAGGALDPGTHRIELRASGYDTRTFDVRISPGETITYREDLSRVTPQVAPGRTAAAKTFYVIPGCYAGDKPPSITTAARSCDRSKLRTIPPVIGLRR